MCDAVCGSAGSYFVANCIYCRRNIILEMEGLLLWNENWVTFLDTMLHVLLLAESGTKTKLVTRISSLRIDPVEHEKFITTLEDSTKGLIPVTRVGLLV